MTPHAHSPSPAAPLALPSAPAAEHPGTSVDLEIGPIQRFKALMAQEGQPVEVARMFSDRLYAYERIACAHASGHAGLRSLALALFQSCHRADEQRKVLC